MLEIIDGCECEDMVVVGRERPPGRLVVRRKNVGNPNPSIFRKYPTPH
jgi:hypothetical protein